MLLWTLCREQYDFFFFFAAVWRMYHRGSEVEVRGQEAIYPSWNDGGLDSAHLMNNKEGVRCSKRYCNQS